MPITTYNSPPGLRGGTGWSPKGFLGGALFGQHEEDYRRNLGMGEASQKMGLLDQLNKLKEYEANAPVRESGRLADIATNRATASTIGTIKGGQAANARVDIGTVDSRIGEAALKHKQGLRKEQQEQMHQDMVNWANLSPALSSVKGSPLEQQFQYQELKKQHPELKLPEQYDPKEIRRRSVIANSYLDAAWRNSEAGRKEAETTKRDTFKEGEATKRTLLTNASGERRAGITASALKNQSPAQRFTRINQTLNNPGMLQQEAENMGVPMELAQKMLSEELATLRTDAAEKAALDEIKARQFEIFKGKTTADQIRSEVYTRRGLPPPSGQSSGQALPPQAESKLQEGVATTFANGQVWTKKNGQSVRIK